MNHSLKFKPSLGEMDLIGKLIHVIDDALSRKFIYKGQQPHLEEAEKFITSKANDYSKIVEATGKWPEKTTNALRCAIMTMPLKSLKSTQQLTGLSLEAGYRRSSRLIHGVKTCHLHE